MDELPHENVKECWDFYTKAKAEAFIIENTYPTYWNQENIAEEFADVSIEEFTIVRLKQLAVNFMIECMDELLTWRGL